MLAMALGMGQAEGGFMVCGPVLKDNRTKGGVKAGGIIKATGFPILSSS